MNALTFDEIRQMIPLAEAEGGLFEEVNGLRNRFHPDRRNQFRNEDREATVSRAIKALGVIQRLVVGDKDISRLDPAHGFGHWCRDFIHALMLATDPEVDVRYVLSCVLGGTMHDIGALYVDRYAERTRVVRHAEIAALLVRAAAVENGVLTEEEADAVAYAIAAHTHYFKTHEVRCADGITRQAVPYQDGDADGPWLEVWLPRWVDRLDCNGCCYCARHYLTQSEDHEDHGQHGFYRVVYADHMQPLLRNREVIHAAGGNQTVLEHLRMFTSSQTNDTPYGCHDFGRMVKLRDAYRLSLDHIIEQVLHPTFVDVERMMVAWTQFLRRNNEPNLSKEAAHRFECNFRTLSGEARRSWACGFRTTMTEYIAWADHALIFLGHLPSASLSEAGIFSSVRTVIRPDPAWLTLIVS